MRSLNANLWFEYFGRNSFPSLNMSVCTLPPTELKTFGVTILGKPLPVWLRKYLSLAKWLAKLLRTLDLFQAVSFTCFVRFYCAMSSIEHGSTLYPNRKRRILNTFSTFQYPHHEKTDSQEDNSDEVEVICVVPKHLAVPRNNFNPVRRHISASSTFSSPSAVVAPENRTIHHPKSLPIQLPLRSKVEPCIILDPPEGNIVPRVVHSPESISRQPQQSLKVVKKVADGTWIEIDLPYSSLEDGERLKNMSSTLETFATSCRTILDSSSPPKRCSCQQSVPLGLGESSSSHWDVVPPQEPLRKVGKHSKRPMQFVLNDPEAQDSEMPIIEERSCSICSAPVESFHLNYGVSSCYSCRAFFRRSVQKHIYPKFVCHFGRRCVLTPYNRSDCRRCRFQKCLDQGMKTTSVLSHGQKMVRFRKHISRNTMEQINQNLRTNTNSLRSFRRPKKRAELRSM